jgi:AcrR family transcriptional regulator
MPRQRQAAADDAGTRPLWFTPPGGEQNRRPVLTRDRVVAEALAIISAGGAAALSMRALATGLGVVPAALYRHVTSKEQLYDLILDGVLAEVDCQARPPLGRAGHRARAPAADGPRRPPRHRRPAPDPRPGQPRIPRPGRGVPRPAARRRPARPPWPSG